MSHRTVVNVGVVRGRAVGSLAVFALTISLIGFTHLREPEPRFAGEYGLFVHYDSSEVKVGWLTSGLREARLIVLANGDTLADFDTPESRSHLAVFPRPEDGSFALEYGGAPGSDDWHRTAIDLRRADQPVQPIYKGVDSIFVIGDTHGEFDRVRRLLANAGLINATARWSGGSSHLVFLGDVFDRGEDVTALLWFIYRLEVEAEAAGGRVHVVLGNHEIMAMTDDLRYVARKERLVSYLHQVEYADLFSPRHSVLGRWLATKPVLLRIDEVLLAHGGVSPVYLDYSLKDFRDTLSSYIDRGYFGLWDDSTYWANLPREAWPDSAAFARHWDFFWDPSSVFWYRGYLRPGEPAAPDTLGLDRLASDSIAAARIAEVLKRHDAKVHVIAHTTVGTIEERFGGSLIAVDLEEAGAEMLLLVRSDHGGPRERLRFTLEGPPAPLSSRSVTPWGPLRSE